MEKTAAAVAAVLYLQADDIGEVNEFLETEEGIFRHYFEPRQAAQLMRTASESRLAGMAHTLTFKLAADDGDLAYEFEKSLLNLLAASVSQHEKNRSEINAFCLPPNVAAGLGGLSDEMRATLTGALVGSCRL
jgi:hypothetical protein